MRGLRTIAAQPLATPLPQLVRSACQARAAPATGAPAHRPECGTTPPQPAAGCGPSRGGCSPAPWRRSPSYRYPSRDEARGRAGTRASPMRSASRPVRPPAVPKQLVAYLTRRRGAGTYAGSCRGCRVDEHKNLLICTHCKNGAGVRVKSVLDMEFCDVFGNNGGELFCAKPSNADGVPTGTYTDTCGGCMLDADGIYLMCSDCLDDEGCAPPTRASCTCCTARAARSSVVVGCRAAVESVIEMDAVGAGCELVNMNGELACVSAEEAGLLRDARAARAEAARKLAESLLP